MYRTSTNLQFLKTDYVICVCEGAAEEAIMDLLLDNDCLLFTRDNLVGHKVTRKRKASEIAQEYLNRDYSKDVHILRILDSRAENFKLGKLYDRYQANVRNIYTRPEIEILLIIAEGYADKYRQQRKSDLKPSTFCKTNLKLGEHIKSRDFIMQYFSNITILIETLKSYHQSQANKNELSIYDLIDVAKLKCK